MALAGTFQSIGAVTSAYIAYKIVDHAYTFLRPSSIARYLHQSQQKDPWALVTGASDGIGKAIADELLRTGFNVVLHGRNPSKLQGVADQYQKSYPSRQIRQIVIDASTAGPEEVKSALQKAGIFELPLTVLVNNVGGMPLRGFPFLTFTDYPAGQFAPTISMNATFMLYLNQALLPILIRSKPSLILNIGSGGAVGMPWLSLYTPSKAFMKSWSNSIRQEMVCEGHPEIEVLHLDVGEVKTQRWQSDEGSFFEPTPDVMAKAALRTVGCGKASIAAYWPHWLIWTIGTGLIPQGLLDRLTGEKLGEMRQVIRKLYKDE